MVIRTVQVGTSRNALRRRRRSSLLSREWSAGSIHARQILSQRHRGFLSLSVGMPWQQRLELANAARKRNREARAVEKAKADALRPYMESTRDL
jgi:hypothetical protein